jgi:hypothetical protein
MSALNIHPELIEQKGTILFIQNTTLPMTYKRTFTAIKIKE